MPFYRRELSLTKPGPRENRFLFQQKLADAASEIDNLADFASLLLDFSVASIRAEKGSIWLQDGRREELYIICSRGIPPEIIRDCRVSLGEGIAGVVANGRRPVFVPRIEHDRGFRSWQRYGGQTPSFIACPVISRNRLLGLLTLSGRDDGRPFSWQDFALSRRIAEQAALPLDNYHLAEQLQGNSAPSVAEGLSRFSREWRDPLNLIYGAVYHLRSSRRIGEKERDDFLAIIARETKKLIVLSEHQTGLQQRGNALEPEPALNQPAGNTIPPPTSAG